jgi:hypothetical protein
VRCTASDPLQHACHIRHIIVAGYRCTRHVSPYTVPFRVFRREYRSVHVCCLSDRTRTAPWGITGQELTGIPVLDRGHAFCNLGMEAVMALTRDADSSEPVPDRRSRIAIAREAVIFGCAFLVNFGVRGLTEGDRDLAVQNARQVIELERALGLNHEAWLQRLVVNHHWLVTAANWVYIWGHWPVIIGTGAWLMWTCPATYRLVRNTFLISGSIGLLIFATFPVAHSLSPHRGSRTAASSIL